MKIIETRSAPNARRVRIFLAEKNIPMQYQQIDIEKGDNLTREFKQKNPLAKVPLLQLDDGSYLSESVAICRYFEELHPEPPLFGHTPLERATIEMWQRRAEWCMLMPVGMCFQHTTGYFKDRMQPIPQWGEVCAESFTKFMHLLNRHLQHSPYLAGESYTIADITALCAVDFARVVNLRIDPAQTDLLRWHQQVQARPSAQA